MQVKNLNRTSANSAFVDLYGVEKGVSYVISVKARNKYEHRLDGNRRLNSRYKLGEHCHEHAREAELRFNARAAWLVLSLEPCTFSAYFGLLGDLRACGVTMSARAVASYRCLARAQAHGLDFAKLQNVYLELEEPI